MTSSLDEAIFQVKATIENKLDSVKVTKEKLDKLIRLKKLKEKRLNGEKLSNDEIHEAQKITCYGNLAHCCKYTKQCPWFLSVCDTLGLEPKEVSEFKEKAMEKFLEENLL